MTIREFSDQFTVLLDSYGISPAFGETKPAGRIILNEYEKSVFLTMAQTEILQALYDGRNILGESFEETEELRRYLSPLVKSDELTPAVAPSNVTPVSDKSVFCTLSDSVAFIVHEQAVVNISCGGGYHSRVMSVVPVTHDEYDRLSRNPFRRQNERKVLRLDCRANMVELVSDYTISKYKIRYIAKPLPIILEDLTGTGVSIEGKVEESGCSLDPSIHDMVLRKAVQLAVATKGIVAN